jgi:hypothetical protein
MFDRSRICRHGEGQGTFLVRTCNARGIPRSRSCPSIVFRLAPLYHALTLSSNDYFDVRVSVDSALPLTTRQVTMTSPAHDAASTQREATRGQPPPLPPRLQSEKGPQLAAMEPSIKAMSSHDPRSSSTQSLVPDPTVDSSNLRRVLLVFIHGFMGNETSFRSFPAHLHNLVTVTLADTHVVHTKLYPRYQSRNTLEIARDNFSNWYTTIAPGTVHD